MAWRSTQAKEEVARRLESRAAQRAPGRRRQVNYRLRDWGISRQRYWGCPIPVIHCGDCGVVPVPQPSLPVHAAGGRRLRPARQSARPPSELEACGLPAAAASRLERETDTMDTFVEFVLVFRALHRPLDAQRPTSRRRPTHWMPVDQYIGGIEHAILHLLYSRFFTRAMKRDRACRHRGAVRRALHAGHGRARDLSRRRTAPGSARPR